MVVSFALRIYRGKYIYLPMLHQEKRNILVRPLGLAKVGLLKAHFTDKILPDQLDIPV